MAHEKPAGDTSNTRIREAVIADASTIAEFNIAMAMETESHALNRKTVNQGVAAVFGDSESGFYLVAEYDGIVAGCLMVTTEWSDWRNGRFWWIQSVYVAPNFRGHGLYRALYTAVHTRALNAGDVCGIRLYVEKDNRNAQSVYRKLGMDNTGYLVFEEPLKPG